MRAVVARGHGGPKMLGVEEVEKPIVANRKLLVKNLCRRSQPAGTGGLRRGETAADHRPQNAAGYRAAISPEKSRPWGVG